MAAESWDDATRRQTPLFSSVDGVAWDRIAPLDFALQFLRATTFGLFAMGDRGENNSTQWVTAASIDERAWSSSILNIGMTRRSNRCSSTAIEWS